jgi:plastocyanin
MRISLSRRLIPAAIAFAVAIVLAIAAFAPSLQKEAAAQTAADVSIVDFEFQPATTTVEVGATVTWTNNGAQMHSATGDAGEFDTGIMAPGTSGSITFNTAGTFTYHCTVHPFMHGTIVVTEAGAAQTPAAQTPTAQMPTTGSGSSAGGPGGLMAALATFSGLAFVLGVVLLRRRRAA